MGWLEKMFAAGAGAFALAMLESVRECHTFRMTHYELHIPGNSTVEKKHCMVFLSDLHNHVYGKENDILLERIQAEQPDLLLIGGDMLIGKRGVLPTPALQFIRQLPEIAPVYYAYGNHEQRMAQKRSKYKNLFAPYEKELREAGVHFLKNASENLTVGEIKIRLTGLMLPMHSYEKFRDQKTTAQEIRRLVGPAAPDRYQILLAHNPAYVSGYKAWGADLVLCGHLHGGVMRIPGWRGVITPQVTLFPRYSGEMSVEEDTTIVVSKGLGTHTVNLRLFNVPEVVVLHF